MAFANSRLGYQPPRLDGKHSAYFEHPDSSAVLDPAILEGAEMMRSPHSAQFRKDSVASSHGVLSPADSHAWDPQYAQAVPVGQCSAAAAAAASNFRPDDNDFTRQTAPHPAVPSYGHPPGTQWTFEAAPGNCGPTPAVEYIPPSHPYQAPPYMHHQVETTPQPNFNHVPPPPPAFHGPPPPPPPQEHSFVPAPQVQTPMSPHSHQDWMGLAQQEMEGRPLPKRSPSTSMLDSQRRDGIRKKNNRIDIPQDRNIHNIDTLIEHATDDELLKELKQQKRLLRNREAALASRQRKKRHTEDLEVKERNFTHQIALLEKDLSDISIDRQRCEEERQMLIHRFQESQRVIETLQDQIRDLQIQHNEETVSLRRKINVLTDQLEAAPAPAMSAAPSSAGFTDFNAEMEALNMGTHAWDNFVFLNDLQNESPDALTFDPRPEQPVQAPILEKKASSSTIMPEQPSPTADSTVEQPIATGLLFMLLLCGAFIASKPASSQPKDMPPMPPDVRAAAPKVLSNLLSDERAVPDRAISRPMATSIQEPGPSTLPYAVQQHPHSRLDRMHQRLVSPTKQQEIDQAFSLTTAQYASITNMDSNVHDLPSSDSASRPRRTLAEILSNMQPEHAQTSKAEVYTRSLLWDQIPTDVVKQFKEMVRDHHELDTRQQRAAGFKTEA